MEVTDYCDRPSFDQAIGASFLPGARQSQAVAAADGGISPTRGKHETVLSHLIACLGLRKSGSMVTGVRSGETSRASMESLTVE